MTQHDQVGTTRLIEDQSPDLRDIRCLCNRLLCQAGEAEIYIKCSKCKRLVKIGPLDGAYIHSIRDFNNVCHN